MRTQIKGDTYVALLPPEYATSLAIYPNLHVSYGHSQLKYVEEDAYLDKNVQHVLMQPGDLLYIPPYWHVRPRSLDTLSLGIDVSSASLGQLHLLEAFYMNLPFDTDDIQRDDPVESKLRRIVAAQVYLLHFMSKLHKNPVSNVRVDPLEALRRKDYKKKKKKKKKDKNDRTNDVDTPPLIPNPMEFMKKLYESRYSSVIPEDSLVVQRNEFQCFRN